MTRSSDPHPGFDLTETDRLLTTTRAVRRRLDLGRPVEREVILECLRIGIQAPTGGNAQGWRWVVVDDPERRAGMAELYRRAFDAYRGDRRQQLAEQGRFGTAVQRVMASAVHLAEHLHEVPVHIVPCTTTRLAAGAPVMRAASLYGSILPATWNFMLALRSRGLGSTWTTLHLDHEREAAELLGIPDTATQVALIPVAYHRGDVFGPAARRPVHDVVSWNGWDRSS